MSDVPAFSKLNNGQTYKKRKYVWHNSLSYFYWTKFVYLHYAGFVQLCIAEFAFVKKIQLQVCMLRCTLVFYCFLVLAFVVMVSFSIFLLVLISVFESLRCHYISCPLDKNQTKTCFLFHPIFFVTCEVEKSFCRRKSQDIVYVFLFDCFYARRIAWYKIQFFVCIFVCLIFFLEKYLT